MSFSFIIYSERRLRFPFTQNADGQEIEGLTHLCSHCLQPEHDEMCAHHIYMCYHCYRLNFNTLNCVCKLRSGIQMYDLPQSFRFVGTPTARPFLDVKIASKTIPGLMDTSSEKSSIDEMLARFVLKMDMFRNSILPSEVRVPIQIGENTFPLKCKVKKLEPSVHLYLAMDFFYFCPFDLTINSTFINSQKYWNTAHHTDIDYVYNHARGKYLHKKLEALNYDYFQTKTQRKF